MKPRLWWAIMLLALVPSLFLHPSPSFAQTNALNTDSIVINVWPEYDQPSVLIRYDIKLSSKVPLPAQLSLRIPPSSVPSLLIYYFLDTNDRPYPLNYRTYEEGQWSRVVFTVPASTLQIEYYDTSLDMTSATRTYTYNWPGDISSEHLSVVVQRPNTATSFTLPPRFASEQLQDDGLYYSTMDLGQVDAGSAFSLDIQYIKNNNRPTYSRQLIRAIQPINRGTSGRFNIYTYLPAIAAALLTLSTLLAILAVAFGRMPKSQLDNAASGTPAGNHPGKQGELPKQDKIYCAVCGTRAEQDDNYCRVCGSRITR